MLSTITLSSCVSVQGIFVKKIADDKVVVRVGDRTFEGKPVTKN